MRPCYYGVSFLRMNAADDFLELCNYSLFTKMNEIVLIDLVRTHDWLYNTKSKNYRNSQLRHEAWEEIARQMGLNVSTVKDSWAKLRNAFLSAKRRRQSKGADGAKKMSAWKYEQEMSFLNPFLETRDALAAMDCEDSIKVDAESEQDRSPDIEDYLILHTEYPPPPPQPASQNISDCKNFDALQIGKRKSIGSPTDEMTEITVEQQNAEFKKAKYSQQRNNSKLGEVEMFYMSMAKVIKRLPAIEQASIRMEFCRMVSEAEIRQLNNKQNDNTYQEFDPQSNSSPLSSVHSSN